MYAVQWCTKLSHEVKFGLKIVVSLTVTTVMLTLGTVILTDCDVYWKAAFM